MDLRNFHSVWLGGGFPWRFLVESVGGHESYGLSATTQTFGPDAGGPDAVIELRRKGHNVALFTLMPGIPVPPRWEDSDLLWTNAEPSGDAPSLAPEAGRNAGQE